MSDIISVEYSVVYWRVDPHWKEKWTIPLRESSKKAFNPPEIAFNFLFTSFFQLTLGKKLYKPLWWYLYNQYMQVPLI